MLEENCVQEGRCEASKGKKERKTRGVKTLSERPLTSAYVYLSGHRVRAHPVSSAAIKLPFPTPNVEKLFNCQDIYRRHARVSDT